MILENGTARCGMEGMYIYSHVLLPDSLLTHSSGWILFNVVDI